MRLIDADALKEAAQTVRETTDAFCELIDEQETIDIPSSMDKGSGGEVCEFQNRPGELRADGDGAL